MRKLLSVILSLALVACMMPSMVFAADVTGMGYTVNVNPDTGKSVLTSAEDQFGIFSDVKTFDAIKVNGTFNGKAVNANVTKTKDAVTVEPVAAEDKDAAVAVVEAIKLLIQDKNAGGAGEELLAVEGAYVQIGDKKAVVINDGTNKYKIEDVAPIDGCKVFIPEGTYQAKGYSVTFDCDFTITTDLKIEGFTGNVNEGVVANAQKLANAAIDAAVKAGNTVNVDVESSKEIYKGTTVDGNRNEKTTTTVIDKKTNVTTVTVVKKDRYGKVIYDRKSVTTVNAAGQKVTTRTGTINGTQKKPITVKSTWVNGKKTSATATVVSDNRTAPFKASDVANITEVAGTKYVTITAYAKTTTGKTAYTVKAKANELQGKKVLSIVRLTTTGKKRLVNSTRYNTVSPGTAVVSLATTTGSKYELINQTEMSGLVSNIKKWTISTPSKVTVRKGRTAKMSLRTTVSWDNIKSVSFYSGRKSVATVTKSKTGKYGIIKGRKAGKATIRMVVTYKNNAKKTVYTYVTVK